MQNVSFQKVFHQFCFQTKTLLIGQTGSYLGEMLPHPHPWKLRIWNFKTWSVSEWIEICLLHSLYTTKNSKKWFSEYSQSFILAWVSIFAWQFHPNSKYFHPYLINKNNLLVCCECSILMPHGPPFSTWIFGFKTDSFEAGSIGTHITQSTSLGPRGNAFHRPGRINLTPWKTNMSPENQ